MNPALPVHHPSHLLSQLNHGHRVVAAPVVACDGVKVLGARHVGGLGAGVLQFDQGQRAGVLQCGAFQHGPFGNEAGGLISLSDSEVIAGFGQKYGTATYDGPTTGSSMGRGFDNWLEIQRGRLPRDTAVLIVHTHPRSTAKPSPDDLTAAVVSSTHEIILTNKQVLIYDKGYIDSSKFICTFNR